MKKILLLLLIHYVFSPSVYGQPITLEGGEYVQPRQICVTEKQYDQIYEQLSVSENRLQQEGKLPIAYRSSQIKFSFPLRQSPSFNYPSFYAISNYVDHNVNAPYQITDYDCYQRSYDSEDGTNHRGIDYFLWPFDNLMQTRNQVEVIAAADGVILNKMDGNDDQNCSFCSNCQWNAVYLKHNDGSVTFYGHLKKNSLTTKAVGASVVRGEYLGIVGSSGYSSGPHLHFEAYKSAPYNRSNLIDPYAGPCNLLNGSESWWDIQPPYFQPRINHIQTQSAPTEFNSCPAPETTYEANEVVRGQTVYFTVYYSDQLLGTTANWQIIRPDNTFFRNFTQNLDATYYNSSWWFPFDIPNNAPLGIWNFRVTYQGKTAEYPFRVGTTTSVAANPEEKQITVYPNPFDNKIWLSSTQPITDCSISIFNTNGLEVYRKEPTLIMGSSLQIDQLNFTKGMYWLVIRNKNKIILRQMLHKN
jgi:hypothetical protein